MSSTTSVYAAIVESHERFENVTNHHKLNLGNGRNGTILCPADVPNYSKQKSLGFYVALIPNTLNLKILKTDLELILKYLILKDKGSIRDVLKYKSRFNDNDANAVSNMIHNQYS